MQKTVGTKDSQETNPLLIVGCLKRKKRKHKQPAELFPESKSAVDKIWTLFKEGGGRVIKSKKRCVQEGRKIIGIQSSKTYQLIKDKLPERLKLASGLGTREAGQHCILNPYGIELNRWQAGKYLKSLGNTPQKPINKALEHKFEKVKEWIEMEFPAI